MTESPDGSADSPEARALPDRFPGDAEVIAVIRRCCEKAGLTGVDAKAYLAEVKARMRILHVGRTNPYDELAIAEAFSHVRQVRMLRAWIAD